MILSSYQQVCSQSDQSDQKDLLPTNYYSEFWHISECLRPLISEILPLADCAGTASQNDKGGQDDA